MNSKTTHCGVGLLAADMQVMATFYRDVLGLETDWDGGFLHGERQAGPLYV